MKPKLLLIIFFYLCFTGLNPTSSEAIEDCQLINKVMSNLGRSMSRHRLIIAQGGDPTIVDEASRALSTETKLYRKANVNTKERTAMIGRGNSSVNSNGNQSMHSKQKGSLAPIMG